MAIKNKLLEAMAFRATQHGEALTASRDPITQITAEYGLSSTVLTASLGGSNSASGGMFITETSASSTGVAATISAREGNQAPGQSMTCILNAVFDTPQENSIQQAGFIQSESALAFGYNGTEFGVLRAYDGSLEHQELTVSTGATSPESATLTLDGTAYTIPLTGSSDSSITAYEIAAYLKINEPRYRVSSNGAVVTVLANLPDFGANSFSFSSGTAAASWSEITNGSQPTEEWTPLSQWNVLRPDIDPSKINEFMIKVDGNVHFYIKDDGSGEFELVHSITRLNKETTTAIRNPTFRVGWGCRNSGNTSNIIVKGSYGAIFNEGEKRLNSPTLGATNTQELVGVNPVNIVSFRNRLVYQGSPNRSEIRPLLLSFGTESNKSTVFEVVKNPTVASGQKLDWQYLDETNSLMEAATNNVIITGGQVVASFTVLGSSLPVNINDIVDFQIPGAEFAITGRNKVVNDSDLTVSGTWKEDR